MLFTGSWNLDDGKNISNCWKIALFQKINESFRVYENFVLQFEN